MNRLRLYRPGVKDTPRPTGQTLVEFALVVLVFLLALMLIIEVGRLLHAFITIQHAAQVGARFAVTGRTDTEWIGVSAQPRLRSVKARTEAAMRGLVLDYDPQVGINNPGDYEILVLSPNDQGVLVAGDPGDPGERVVVRVRYSLPLIAPMLSNIVTSVPLTAQAIMTVETESGGLTEEGVLPPALDISELTEGIPDEWDDSWEWEYLGNLDCNPDDYENPEVGCDLPNPEDVDACDCDLICEAEHLTNPFSVDTDGDGITDCDEFKDGTDPLDPDDFFTPTPTESPTPTDTPPPCSVTYARYLLQDDTFVLVNGHPGDEVTVTDQTTGNVLTTQPVTLGTGDEPWCGVLGQSIPLTEALQSGHSIVVTGTWGFAQDVVVGDTPTPSFTPTFTSTPTFTLTPSFTPTPTRTLTPTPKPSNYAYFDITNINCQKQNKAKVTLKGFNWPTDEGKIYIEWYYPKKGKWKKRAVLKSPTATWVRTVKIKDKPTITGTYRFRARTQSGDTVYTDNDVEMFCGPTPTPSPVPTVPPGQVTLISPSGTIYDTTPLYTWNAEPTALQYRLQVDGSPIGGWFDASTACSGGVCSVDPGVVLTYASHNWQIQARNDYGEGPWSISMAFTVALYGKYVNTGTPASCGAVVYDGHTWMVNRAWNPTDSTDDWGYITSSGVELRDASSYSGTIRRTIPTSPYYETLNSAGQSLYKCRMYSGSSPYTIGYNFEVPDGTYRVRLVFSENWNTYWNSDDRFFDIYIEGTRVANDFDIAQTAYDGCQAWCSGGPPYSEGRQIAVDLVFTGISVTDGRLDIRLVGNEPYSSDKAPMLMGVGVDQTS